MGAATSRGGMIYVTHMDQQFVAAILFRDYDVGSPKSVSCARVVKEWNSQLSITALERKVDRIFAFWKHTRQSRIQCCG